MLVNATNLEYMCTGLTFGGGDLWYPPSLMQEGQTLQVEPHLFMIWTLSSFIFLLTNRIRIDHDVSNQS